MREVIIQVADLPIRLRTSDPEFLLELQNGYSGFVTDAPVGEPCELTLCRGSGPFHASEAARITRFGSRWRFERDDFEVEWLSDFRRGWVRHGATLYPIDSVLRILHTLLIAPEGGFLLHAASAVRKRRAFIFTGVSGAGKTTISRLAPPDTNLLNDEMSYIRPQPEGWFAFGTPFAGRAGRNISAPIHSAFVLAHGHENRRDPLSSAEALRALLGNVFFFAQDPKLKAMVFRSACDFVAAVPFYRLTFVPDHRVWEDIL